RLLSCPSSARPALHSFPTRRSSDLPWEVATRSGSGGVGAGAALAPTKSRSKTRPAVNRRWPLRGLIDASRGREKNIVVRIPAEKDRKSTRLNSSHVKISYAVFCLKK